MAKYLPGRFFLFKIKSHNSTDNAIKNHWNSTMRRRVQRDGSCESNSTVSPVSVPTKDTLRQVFVLFYLSLPKDGCGPNYHDCFDSECSKRFLFLPAYFLFHS